MPSSNILVESMQECKAVMEKIGLLMQVGEDSLTTVQADELHMLAVVANAFEKSHYKTPVGITANSETLAKFLAKEKMGNPPKRELGLLEGKAKLPNDFDEPLEELKDYM